MENKLIEFLQSIAALAVAAQAYVERDNLDMVGDCIERIESDLEHVDHYLSLLAKAKSDADMDRAMKRNGADSPVRDRPYMSPLDSVGEP